MTQYFGKYKQQLSSLKKNIKQRSTRYSNEGKCDKVQLHKKTTTTKHGNEENIALPDIIVNKTSKIIK